MTPLISVLATEWGDYGLVGLVVGALLGVLALVIKWHQAHIERQFQAHREERKEWRESTDKIIEQNTSAVKQTADTMRATDLAVTALTEVIKDVVIKKGE